MPRANPARQRVSEERRQQLLAAALRLMAKRGFADTSIEDVAREAGVAKGTVYLYFDNKEALLGEVLESQSLLPALIPVVEAIAPNAPLPEIVAKIVRVIWSALAERQDAVRMLLREGTHHSAYSLLFLERTLPWNELLTARLRERAGAHLPPEIDPFVAVRALVTMLFGLFVEQHILGGEKIRPMDDETIMRTVTSLFVRGVLGEG